MTTSTTLMVTTNVLNGNESHQVLSFVETTNCQLNETSNLNIINDLVRLKLNNIYTINNKLSNSNVPVQFVSEAIVAATPIARKFKLTDLTGNTQIKILETLLKNKKVCA